MLQIFYKKINNPIYDHGGYITSQNIVLDGDDLIITVSISVKEGEFTKVGVMPLEEYKNGVYYLTLKTNYKESFAFDAKKMFDYVHRDMEDMKTSYPDILIGRVAIEENKDVNIYLTALKSDMDGFKNIQIDMNKDSVTSCLSKHSNTYRTQLERSRVRAKMIRNIDLYSLSLYLENQIDLLTKLALLSVSKNELNADIIKLLKKADGFSCLDIKNYDLVSEEFGKHKSFIQQLQEVYLNDEKISNKAW